MKLTHPGLEPGFDHIINEQNEEETLDMNFEENDEEYGTKQKKMIHDAVSAASWITVVKVLIQYLEEEDALHSLIKYF